jgi:predicted DNA-binding transcriptional regulator YafY
MLVICEWRAKQTAQVGKASLIGVGSHQIYRMFVELWSMGIQEACRVDHAGVQKVGQRHGDGHT